MMLSEIIDGLVIVEKKIDRDFVVNGITADSREASSNYIFFAVKGTKDDGLRYSEEAANKGALVITDRKPDNASINFIRVSDITDAMNFVASRFYKNPYIEMKMIGVTGTNGKSSITFLIESIAKASKINSGIIGTINYRYRDMVIPATNTTPDPLRLMKILSDMRDAGTGLVVMEVSSHGLLLKRTAALKFDVVIFTNLSRDHLDFHKDMEDYFNAKRLLFKRDYSRDQNSVALVNIDDEYGKRLLNESFPKIFSYSLSNKKAFVYCTRYEVGDNNIKADLSIDGKSISVESNLLGIHNLYNIMASAGAMYVCGSSLENIATGISSLEYVPGRLQKVENNFGVRCLVDYAHSDDALRNVLSALKKLSHRKIITIFGAGGDRDRGKRPLMAKAVCEYSDIVIITSDNPRTEDPLRIIQDIESGIDNEFVKVSADSLDENKERVYTIIPDRAQAIKKGVFLSRENDIILIAGKGHEDYIIEGSVKRYFSDIEEARKAFDERGKV